MYSPSPAAGGHKRRHVSFLKSYANTSSVSSSVLSKWPPYTSICPFPAAAEWYLRAAGQPLPRWDTRAHRRCHCTPLHSAGHVTQKIPEINTSGHDKYSKGVPHRKDDFPHTTCALCCCMWFLDRDSGKQAICWGKQAPTLVVQTSLAVSYIWMHHLFRTSHNASCSGCSLNMPYA